MKYSEKLKLRYANEIRAWPWDEIRADALQYEYIDDDGERRAEIFVGSVLSIYPSGKYYTVFANSNASMKDIIQDEAFHAAFELVAEEHDAYVISGDGDPTDVFVGWLLSS